MGNVVSGINAVNNGINADGKGSQSFTGSYHNVSSDVSNFTGTGVNFTGANQLVNFNGTGVSFGSNAKITYSDPQKISMNGTNLFDSSNKIQATFIPNITGAIQNVPSISSTGGVTGANFYTSAATGTFFGGSFSGTTGIFSGAVTGSTFYGNLGAATVSYNALTGTSINTSNITGLTIISNPGAVINVGNANASNASEATILKTNNVLQAIGGVDLLNGNLTSSLAGYISLTNGKIATTNGDISTTNGNISAGGTMTSTGLLTASGGITSSGLIKANGGLTGTAGYFTGAVTGANLSITAPTLSADALKVIGTKIAPTTVPTNGLKINGQNSWTIGENSSGQLCFYNSGTGNTATNKSLPLACIDANGNLVSGKDNA